VATVEIAKRTATRPTWAEISLGALRHNFRVVQAHVKAGVEICAVVKADAYGHGAVECARALEAEGARWLGVTSLDEAIGLREEVAAVRVLLMTGFWKGEEEEVIRLRLTPTIWECGQISQLERAAKRLGVERHAVHLKLDSGMGRLGALPEDLDEICAALRSSPHLYLEGLSTHLASSEVLGDESVSQQLIRFDQMREHLRREGFSPAFIHASNTSALISRPQAWYNMVRPGIGLYGYHLPFENAPGEATPGWLELRVKPALTWKTRVLSLRQVGAHQPLGYGGTYVTRERSRIAVLPVGYADGFNRHLSRSGRVILRQGYAPIVGRVSMDLTLVDVTRLSGVEVGDEVILLGAREGWKVDALEHAALADTVVYEILCAISKRVPRKYVL
jgi:alanine racemase